MDPNELRRRIEAIDYIEFHILEAPGDDRLKRRAEQVRAALEEMNEREFRILRREIRPGHFESLVEPYTTEADEEYTYLDIFLNRLFPYQTIPENPMDLDPDMVPFQKTPARLIIELLKIWHPTKEDVFYDIGSGLGQAAILVHLLTGIQCRGVEIDPALCEKAQACTSELGLKNMRFINCDARKADFSEGTLFYLCTPFRGAVLETVLSLLKNESIKRKVTIVTLGPCSETVTKLPWLRMEETTTRGLSVFSML